ncbi:DUF406 family protein [Mangrovibacter phragmitis]|nr:DUF406 family protein [Mangrovibacter phragmitis]
MSQSKAQQMPVCSCVDVGTIKDNADYVATMCRVFDSNKKWSRNLAR